jgi:hypothetical protein
MLELMLVQFLVALCMGLAAVSIFIWAVLSGLFKNVEDIALRAYRAEIRGWPHTVAPWHYRSLAARRLRRVVRVGALLSLHILGRPRAGPGKLDESELAMTDEVGKERPTIIPWIILGLALVNLAFLLIEIALNVFGAMLPL